MFTDGDLAKVAALEELQITHFLCVFHIMRNMRQKLAGALGKRLAKFLRQFTDMRQSIDEATLVLKWK